MTTAAYIAKRQRPRSILRSAFDRIVDAREQQARRHIAEHLGRRHASYPESAGLGRGSLFEAGAPERH